MACDCRRSQAALRPAFADAARSTEGGAIGAAGVALASAEKDELGAALEVLIAAPSATARWLAVLARDAGPGRGWTDERLRRLARLQADPAAEVSGAALAIVPPREIAASRRERGPEGEGAQAGEGERRGST